MESSGGKANLAALIQEQSDLKARVIDAPDYVWPQRLTSGDWIITAVWAVAMIIVTLIGFGL